MEIVGEIVLFLFFRLAYFLFTSIFSLLFRNGTESRLNNQMKKRKKKEKKKKSNRSEHHDGVRDTPKTLLLAEKNHFSFLPFQTNTPSEREIFFSFHNHLVRPQEERKYEHCLRILRTSHLWSYKFINVLISNCYETSANWTQANVCSCAVCTAIGTAIDTDPDAHVSDICDPNIRWNRFKLKFQKEETQ